MVAFDLDGGPRGDVLVQLVEYSLGFSKFRPLDEVGVVFEELYVLLRLPLIPAVLPLLFGLFDYFSLFGRGAFWFRSLEDNEGVCKICHA